MLSQHYCNLVALQNAIHTYHIKTLNKDFVIHGYLWDLYSALVDQIDTIGEQMIIIEESVPLTRDCLKNTDYLEPNTDIPQEIVSHLYDCFEDEKEALVKLANASMDEWTRNLVADQILFFGKSCAKLKSLMDEDEEEED